ncbi:MAG: ATP-grasp domain-containing protein [Pseudobdellovibrio sp.]
MSLNKKTIGLIGGRQLAQMLTQRAREMGYDVIVLCNDKDDPAVKYATSWIKGHEYNEQDLKKLIKKVDVVTFENEAIPARTLDKALKATQTECFPKTEHLATLQDHWSQKELMWDYDIPTPEFIKITSKDDLEAAYTVFKGQLVLKKRLGNRNGGADTYLIKTRQQFNLFQKSHLNKETQFIAEKYVHFKNEKALIMSRNQEGDLFIYPLFTAVLKENQRYRVYGPENHKKLKHLIEKITLMLNKLDYVGLISFDLFDTGTDLLISEITPRASSSGHITQDAFSIDQFELHIRALTGLSFPKEIHSTQKFLMQNIIGKSIRKPIIAGGLQGKLHWYNKKNNKAKRKLGHINYLGKSIKALNLAADSDLKKIKS